MLKKVVLLAAALTLAVPAFADTPNATTKAAKAPAPKVSPRKRFRNASEVHSFSYPVTAPLDNHSPGQPIGKRKHNLIPVKPPK